METTASLDARAAALRELQTVPGVGTSIARDLYSLGVRSVAGLGRKNPELLYRRLEALTRSRQDPCVLYTFRCAVYFARVARPDPELLKWWNWMAATPGAGGAPRNTQFPPRSRG